MVTHEPDVAEWTRRTVFFRDGVVVDDRLTEQRPKVTA